MLSLLWSWSMWLETTRLPGIMSQGTRFHKASSMLNGSRACSHLWASSNGLTLSKRLKISIWTRSSRKKNNWTQEKRCFRREKCNLRRERSELGKHSTVEVLKIVLLSLPPKRKRRSRQVKMTQLRSLTLRTQGLLLKKDKDKRILVMSTLKA